MSYERINDLGSYASEADLWQSYPAGGMEGDYALAGGTTVYWDRVLSRWVTGDGASPADGGSTAGQVTADGGDDAHKDSDENIGVNSLGRFDNVGDVWELWPEGGREGDYVEIGGVVYYWNKYTQTWDKDYAANNKTEGTAGTDVDIPRSEINNLGCYDSLSALWERWPEGGREGDYADVGGVRYYWNWYTHQWQSGDITTGTPLPVSEVPGGDVIVKAVELTNVGSYDSLQALWQAYPSGGVLGDYADIGGVRHWWNPYTSQWQNSNSGVSHSGERTYVLDGNLLVNGSLAVNFDILCKKLEERLRAMQTTIQSGIGTISVTEVDSLCADSEHTTVMHIQRMGRVAASTSESQQSATSEVTVKRVAISVEELAKIPEAAVVETVSSVPQKADIETV